MLVAKDLPANVGDTRDMGLISELGRSPGEGKGNPLQSSCLENPRDGGAWWAAVSGVAQSQTQLKQLSSSSSRNHQRVSTVNYTAFSLFMYSIANLWPNRSVIP